MKIETSVRQAIQKANHVIYQYSLQKPDKAGDSGTTVSMAVAYGPRFIVANVGDSRTYILRNHTLRQISQDHSLVASLVASGQIKPEEIYLHPQRNVIYRSLGQKRQVQIDTFWETLETGDFLLLCTDGLWEMVQDEKLISRIIEAAESPEKACRLLVDTANVAGGEDNIGVVVVQVV
jgi:protein phosphatase